MDLTLLLAIVGWIGALCTVTAYALLTAGRLPATSALFQAMNIVGAGLLCVSATTSQAWPSATVNAVWVLIGLQGVFMMARALRRRGAATAPAAVDATEISSVTDIQTAGVVPAESYRVEMTPTLVMPIIRDDAEWEDHDVVARAGAREDRHADERLLAA